MKETERPMWETRSAAVGSPEPSTQLASWDPRTGRWAEPGDLQEVFPRFRPDGAPPPHRGAWPAWALATLGGLVGAAVVLAAVFAIPALRPRAGTVAVERQLDPGIATRDTGGSSIVEIATKARPWVVNVSARVQSQGIFGPQLAQGTGSGVIIRSDGHIVTNAHVVGGAEDLEITLASGETLDAEIVGADTDTDVAVLKVDRRDLPSAVIGSAKDVEVGELAVAIGSPLGLEQSVTAGIVSALGRVVERTELGLPPLLDMIQTDAPITQGNSGGALIDGNGALVGINTAIAASPDVGAEGIAFAIPIDIAKTVADQIIDVGRVTHPWIGIRGTNIDAETARQFGIGQGAIVIEVVPDGPADRAGLQPRDIVVGFDGETITTMDELVVEIREREVGDTVTVEIVRDGETTTLEMTLGDRPDDL